MLASFVVGLALAGQAMVQVPVDDPVLPTGPLAFMGEAIDGHVYVHQESWERSDLPGRVRGTAVIVDGGVAPLWVVLTWIDCDKHVYQLSTGRRYDADGREAGSAAWVRDRAIASGTAFESIESTYCPAKAAAPDRPKVASFREALAFAHSSR